jgi:glycosyltransferase involved in cell wall biosynthesis
LRDVLKVALEQPTDSSTGAPVSALRRLEFTPVDVRYFQIPCDRWSNVPPFDPRQMLGVTNRLIDPLIPGFSALLTSGLCAHINLSGVHLVHTLDVCYHTFNKPTIYERSMTADYLLRNYYGLSNARLERVLRFERAVLSRGECTSVIAWSSWAKSELMRLYNIPSQKIFVVPPVIPLRKKVRTNSESSAIRILVIGLDYYRKNVPMVFRVFERLKAQFDNLRMTVRTNVPNGFDEKSIPQGCDVVGKMDLQSVQLLYDKADIFFLPTQADSYGVALLEAMSHGLPVVASNLPPLRELVSAPRGFLREREDEDGFVDCLTKLIDDASLRQGLGVNGCIFVRKNFAPEIVAEKLSNVYRASISRS